jgi:hypothetical protein
MQIGLVKRDHRYAAIKKWGSKFRFAAVLASLTKVLVDTCVLQTSSQSTSKSTSNGVASVAARIDKDCSAAARAVLLQISLLKVVADLAVHSQKSGALGGLTGMELNSGYVGLWGAIGSVAAAVPVFVDASTKAYPKR